MFLVVPGCYTSNIPEYVAIVRVCKDVSFESVVDWVYEEEAREPGELAEDGTGAMAFDAIDWSAVTACPPSARCAEWRALM
jgi:hypothetical protein